MKWTWSSCETKVLIHLPVFSRTRSLVERHIPVFQGMSRVTRILNFAPQKCPHHVSSVVHTVQEDQKQR